MPFVRPPGPYPIEGVSLETWLVRFDEAGVCTSPETRAALLEKIAAKPTTPLLILSHGWNNDFADAVLLYKNFLTHFQKIVADHPLAGPEPLVIGIIWPSMWWPSDPGPKMAAVASAREVEESGALEDAVQELAATLDTAKRARFYELTEAKGLTEPEAHELAQFLKPMLRGSDDGKPEVTCPRIFGPPIS
jgi:hypothetical protein